MKKWITAILLIAAAAVAQQTHSQYEPANAPGAGQKLLAQFAGDWDVVKTFFPMNGKPIVTKGTCKQYMVQDGKFLQSDFTFFNSDGTQSTGTGISGFDSKTNRFTTCGTTRGRRRCRFARATARSTARTSCSGPRPSIPITRGTKLSLARTWRKMAAFFFIVIT
ncbi:MAG TPA: DUF1579 family protein [Candidatus Sulfotelmatobacter sp.]